MRPNQSKKEKQEVLPPNMKPTLHGVPVWKPFLASSLISSFLLASSLEKTKRKPFCVKIMEI